LDRCLLLFREEVLVTPAHRFRRVIHPSIADPLVDAL
jgi:hypothetical protein